MSRRVVVVAVLALLCLAAPAEAKLRVGIGEQSPNIFTDTRWIDLQRPDVRYVMAWDALRSSWQRAELDAWMQGARAHGARVLLSFGHSRLRGRELRLPTTKQFVRVFKAVRSRYPWVKTFQTWNEANHGTQPTFRKPEAAARFYDALRRTCRRCTISAPAVMDDRIKTIRWIRRFRDAAKHRVRIWSLHNHIDANRNRLGRASTTSLFLRNTRGQVWFTETGGIWDRWVDGRHIRRYRPKTAVRAIKNVFRLARLAPGRVKRIYVYNWFGPPELRPRWDSGLVDRTGLPRATLRELSAQLRKLSNARGRRRGA